MTDLYRNRIIVEDKKKSKLSKLSPESGTDSSLLSFKSSPPTIPKTVSPETDLDSLNLNWSEHDLPERERTKHVHRLHPYLGKYIPQLVEIFLRKYFTKGQTVLDPFCGSGTTLVQANELGINSIGYDISAFNVLLTKVKTYLYDIEKAKLEVFDILNKVKNLTQSFQNQKDLWEENPVKFILTESSSDYLKEWYSPRALSELLAYRHFIESSDYEYKDLLRIILTRAARSARLTTHFNLDFPKKPQRESYWCYKHSRICTPIDEAFKFLRRYSLDTIRRIQVYSHLRTNAKVEVRHTDSRIEKNPPIDGVITSPPYLGLIDYHVQHAYAYQLLNLEDKSENEIGAAKNGSKDAAQKQYIEDISAVLINIVGSLKPEGKVIVVANDKLNIYDEIIKLSGLKLDSVLKRHVNRRTGMRKSNFFESIFILIK